MNVGSFIAAAGLFSIAAAQTTISYPIAGVAPRSQHYSDHEAWIVTSSGDMTTYHVLCPRDTNVVCLQRAQNSAMTDYTFTIAAGPSSYDYNFDNGYGDSISSTCTFTGAPSVTTGTCFLTQTDPFGSQQAETETVPSDDQLTEIYYQSLTVYGRIEDRYPEETGDGGDGGSAASTGSSADVGEATSTGAATSATASSGASVACRYARTGWLLSMVAGAGMVLLAV